MSALHDHQHDRKARLVRQFAELNPTLACWRCGLTRSQHGRKWQAGHTVDGDPLAQPWLSVAEPPPGSWLRAECERCNASAGAARGNELRTRPGTTRKW